MLSKLDRLAFISADGRGGFRYYAAATGKSREERFGLTSLSHYSFRVIGFHFSYSYLQHCLCSA